MYQWVLEQFIKPVVRRVATAVSFYLVGQGVAESDVAVITTGLSTAIFIVVELLFSARSRASK